MLPVAALAAWVLTRALLTVPLCAGASRVESFLLEEPAPPGDGAAAEPEPVAVVVLRRVERNGEVLLEQDVTFRAGGVRLLHDEARGPEGGRLVRRELRGPGSRGRTWILEHGEEGTRRVNLGSSLAVHGRIEGRPWFPLELLEALRLRADLPAELDLFDPLTEGSTPVRVRTRSGDPRGVAVAGRRTCEVTRLDGSLVGRYVFSGVELVAFQWQDGPRWARLADPDFVRRRAREWRVDHDPVESVWRAVRARRVHRR